MNAINSRLQIDGQFLIDTGCEGNIVKKSFISPDLVINELRAVRLKGLGNDLLPTLGSVMLPFWEKSAEFQVVPDDFPIPAEGMIGAAFLTETQAIIEFKTRMMIWGERIIPLHYRVEPELGPFATVPDDTENSLNLVTSKDTS
ncbi:hypothetical protein QAD02_005012 [Eretmocerus hayati]|uniref:Uncharacterized protein n=1 Tax=Eretmocerus hayati TaxID=131215 RepID=A0ACC2NR49_9HYME|nr:hypothetical protein QAD02_005012 [Eretmocerus hayati]